MQKDALFTKDFTLIILTNLALFLSFQMINPILPVYVNQMGGSNFMAGIVVGVLSFTATISRPIAGYCLDVIGRKITVLVSMVLVSLTILLQGFTASIVLLLFIRAIQGFFWGSATSGTATIATDIISPKRLAEGMGYFGMASSIATALGPSIGIYLMLYYSFKVTYIASAMFIIIGVIMLLNIAFIVLPPGAERKKGYFERRALRPAVLMFFASLTYGGISSFVGAYALHLKLDNISLYFVVYSLTLLVTRPFIGSLVDKKGYDVVIIPSMISFAVSSILFSYTTNIVILILGGFFFALGFGSLLPSLQAMTVVGIEPNRRGAANSTYYVGFDMGVGLGAILFGRLVQQFGYAISFRMMLLPAAAVVLVFLYTLKRNNRRQENIDVVS